MTSEAKPRLVTRFGGVAVRTYALDKASITLGRRSSNDVQLDDPAVSALHARLRLEESPDFDGHVVVYLEDAGSTNGTRVNGERVTHRRLSDGDIVGIGSHELAYEEGDGPLESTLFLLSDTLAKPR